MTTLRLDGLAVTLGSRLVLDGVSLTLPAGALTAVLGPNGAGKTSLLRAAAGLIPFRGRLTLDDADLCRLPARERARRIAYLPQRADIAWPMAVRDVVGLGRLPHGDPLGRLTAADGVAVEAALARLDLGAFASRRVSDLSGGERARVLLARVLATEAPVLLLDEPIAALDPAQQFAVLDLLAALAAEGRTIVVVLHDLMLAARFATRVAVLQAGRLAAEGPPEATLSDALLADVFGLRAERIRLDGRMVPVLQGRL